MKSVLFIISFILLGQTTQAAVWTVENQWSEDWEKTYSEWVERRWDDEVFMRDSSLLKNVATDCADASYSMRMLFSYLNQLPFQIYNPNDHSKFISQNTNQFDKELDPHKKFIQFVNFVNDNTDSGSLANDTYPIEITRQYFRPGIVYVSPHDHTYQIIKINENGIPTIMSSTTPKDIRYLQITNSFPFYIPNDFKNYRDGYRAFKQPQHYSLKKTDLPGYSLQQFILSQKMDDDILAFGETLSKILQVREETLAEKIQRSMLNLCNAVQLRANVISWTIFRKQQSQNKCLNSIDYNNESTPSRDRRIKIIFNHLHELFMLDEGKTISSYSVLMNPIFSESLDVSELNRWCEFSNYGQIGAQISLRDVWHAIQNDKLISDPNANMFQRWGLEDFTPECPIYE